MPYPVCDCDGLIVALLVITTKKSVDGIKLATMPMVILGQILSNWLQTEHVTMKQLEAWSMARRSFLFNEVLHLLDRFENVIVGYAVTSAYFTSDQAFVYVALNRPLSPVVVYGVLINLILFLICIKVATEMYTVQHNHEKLLMLMKEGVLADDDPLRNVRATLITQMIENIKHADCELTLTYIPLNPKFQKFAISYFVGAFATIIGKYYFKTTV
jgi:hypothetical protein